MSTGAGNRRGTAEGAAVRQAMASVRVCERKRGCTHAAASGKEEEREGPWGQKDRREVKWAPTDPAVVGQISTKIQSSTAAAQGRHCRPT
jgi:hypothetical protein